MLPPSTLRPAGIDRVPFAQAARRGPGSGRHADRIALVLSAACVIAACVTTSTASMLPVAAGSFVLGSGPEERAWAYAHAPAGVHAQGWYDAWERPPHRVALAAFSIDRSPVTQRAYAEFVRQTGHRAPGISESAYRRQGFGVHPYRTVRGYLWHGDAPPPGLGTHPVVLVDRDDARAYCAWKGLRLPTEAEWEAACRGPDGRRFPWGDRWEPGRVHAGAEGTAPVAGSKPSAAGPDTPEMLGNVFEWTASAFAPGRATLKGCSWDDAPGTCRCAFRHGRPAATRHVLIGFRCAADASRADRG